MKKDEHIELIIKEFNKLEIKCEKQAKAYSKQSEVCASQDFRMKELMIENGQLMTTLCEQQDEIKSLKENTKTATTTDSTGSVRSSFFGLIKSPSSASSPSSSSSPLSSSSSSLSSFSSSSSSSSVPINPSGSNHVVEKREKTCPGNHGLCLTKLCVFLIRLVQETMDSASPKRPYYCLQTSHVMLVLRKFQDPLWQEVAVYVIMTSVWTVSGVMERWFRTVLISMACRTILFLTRAILVTAVDADYQKERL
eukprot:CAMPEP_0114369896 /NCGR_PEP_ID=MMETSP0101-20121206/32059_1 /TAXON_ID=38822 ORGANISM="Pteridomonas danica, Strain PT" /NCGR_SAMPLE_ID=MMETSP0101 /ASSEMBLY_ACC=CAM_ASM_000211 /LENGTH=251 /DNA_ID=CAMNT_0001521065 /DNA_START=662 /DNA_END=1417 /DNA_ORIENTATION=-